MSTVERILESLPPTYAVEPSSVVAQFLGALALELDAYAEDLDRYRRTHWFDQVYRVGDLEKLAALVGVTRRSWEELGTFRDRVRALVDARLDGSVGPNAIRTYVFEAIRGAEDELDGTIVPGLAERVVTTPDDRHGIRASPASLAAAFAGPDHPDGPLQLVENPARAVRSAALAGRGGLVPYLHRWTDTNHGIEAAPVSITVTGRSAGRTAIPVLANLTTGTAIGFAGVLRVGQRLSLAPAPDPGADGRLCRALLDDRLDVTDRTFSLTGFRLGNPFALDQGDDPGPVLPVQARGANEWIYLSAALYEIRGLDATYFQLADDALREGAFDSTSFDQALFASPVAARVELGWTEQEPAAFSVVVPYGIVALPTAAPTPQPGQGLAAEIAAGMAADLDQLRAAGVHAELVLRPFRERQEEFTSVALPWVVVPPETGPAGQGVRIGVGGRFGESTFDTSRFE